ncbi:MAG: hypothetical protein K2M03_03385 [Muribaculaceae bacterium]|nr:hypothetical protein [Muribaculaceae bacterium]
MRTLSVRPKYRHIFTLLVIISLCACNRTAPEITKRLNHAERTMDSQPDSALSLLTQIDTTSLKTTGDRAKYALLLSQALDKNYIDTTDFSALQPAIDFYEKNGTPDQRLQTLYYKGRIYMNRGEDTNAMMTFLKARNDIPRCTNPRSAALLYEAMGVIYHRQYWMESYIDVNNKAAEYYMAANDTVAYLRSKTKVLYASVMKDYSTTATHALNEISEIPEHIEWNPSALLGLKLRYYHQFGTPTQLDSIIKHYQTLDSTKTTVYVRMDYADILAETGAVSDALSELNIINRDIDKAVLSDDDSLKYYAIAANICKINGQYERAIDYYEKYLNLSEEHYEYLFDSGVMFAKEKYEYELDNVRKDSKFYLYLYSYSILILALLITIIVIAYTISIVRKKKNRLKWQKAQLQLKYHNLIIDNVCLETEKNLTHVQLEKASMEKDYLSLLNNTLTTQIKILENEKQRLIDIMEAHRGEGEEKLKLISSRIDILNGYLRMCITGDIRHGTELIDIQKDIEQHKQKFLEDLTDYYLQTYPVFKQKCDEATLTSTQIQYLSLLAMGLTSKEAGIYLDINRINHFAVNIRSKLQLENYNSSLSQYIKQLLG